MRKKNLTQCPGLVDHYICLMRVVYLGLAFFMRSETASGSDLDLYRRAETVLDACIARAERGEAWTLIENELADVERVLSVHDEQLAVIPKHRYLAALDHLQRFVLGRGAPRFRCQRSRLDEQMLMSIEPRSH
nr:hypothetical protein [Burkholderia pyrrocinia]